MELCSGLGTKHKSNMYNYIYTIYSSDLKFLWLLYFFSLDVYPSGQCTQEHLSTWLLKEQTLKGKFYILIYEHDYSKDKH